MSTVGRTIVTAVVLTIGLASLSPCWGEVTSEDYVRLLEKWNATARRWTHQVKGNEGLAYYATGGHEHWAVQAQCTAMAGIATLATAPELDEQRAGETREQLRERALGMLRYTLHTHMTGSETCTTGKAWGTVGSVPWRWNGCPTRWPP